jgi:16S rRNA (guanine966-N2)-methyltransferase
VDKYNRFFWYHDTIQYMRIISGKYKRRQLLYPKDKPELRPTKDMVKEALFSILHGRVENARFLDLCAGVGSIGLEALSRGAREVVFIDRDPYYIYKNAEVLGCKDQVRIYKQDALRAIDILSKKQEQFELIYIDPPYALSVAQDSLNKPQLIDILAPQGWIIVEAAVATVLATPGCTVVTERNYGSTKIIILERA